MELDWPAEEQSWTLVGEIKYFGVSLSAVFTRALCGCVPRSTARSGAARAACCAPVPTGRCGAAPRHAPPWPAPPESCPTPRRGPAARAACAAAVSIAGRCRRAGQGACASALLGCGHPGAGSLEISFQSQIWKDFLLLGRHWGEARILILCLATVFAFSTAAPRRQ